MSRSALSAGLSHLRSHLAKQQHSADSDEQLLHAFAVHRDEGAFAVLVRRHGPMVLHVCRRVLEHEQDAEDAFQATFLVLARKAATLRKHSALASFLHGTAYRLALSAKRAAARRRKYESQTPSRSPVDPVAELSWREVRALLDEEIARLSEKYRSVFILCCLEDLSRAEAAQRLGLTERTVLSRLATARQRLAQRLGRRGVELTAVLAASALTTLPASALPPGLIATTTKAALGDSVSVSVSELVKGAATVMIVSKAKMAAILLVVGVLVGVSVWTAAAFVMPQPGAHPAEPTQAPAASAHRQSTPAAETFTYAGQVFGPDGKPVAGAKIYIEGLNTNLMELRERTVSGPDGKFRFQVRRDEFRGKGDVRYSSRNFPENYVQIAATAEGCGGACVWAGDADKREKLTLWLPAEEIVRGRIISPEGKGIAGVSVSARLSEMGVGKDRKPVPFDAPNAREGIEFSPPVLPSEHTCAVTDREGRFVLRGLSRDWLYSLNINGPTVVDAHAELVARPLKSDGKPLPQRRPRLLRYGSTFTYVAKPCKPIVGMVRDKESGKPLAGIQISRHWITPEEPMASTTTDKNGQYKLLGLPGGIHTLRVDPPENAPYLASEVRVAADQPGLEPATFDISLKRRSIVRGRVIDRATGKPVTAWVEYRPLACNPNLKTVPELAQPRGPRSHPPTAATDDKGRFTLPVLRGRGVLLIRADDRYLPARLGKAERIVGIADTSDPELIDCRPLPAWPGDFHAYRLIDVAQEKEMRIEIRLVPGNARPLVVEFPDGKLRDTGVFGLKPPVNDEILPYRPGKTEILGLADDEIRRLYLTTSGEQFAALATVHGNEKGPIRVKLEPTGTIVGRVVDKDGKPIAGLSFRLLFDDGPGRPGLYLDVGFADRVLTATESTRQRRTKDYDGDVSNLVFQDVKTDEKGRFRLSGVLPDVAFDLEALFLPLSHPLSDGTETSGGKLRIARPTVKPGETLDLGTLHAVRPPKPLRAVP